MSAYTDRLCAAVEARLQRDFGLGMVEAGRHLPLLLNEVLTEEADRLNKVLSAEGTWLNKEPNP